MVGVFFSAVVAAAPSSQYDGGLRTGEADGAQREGRRLTAIRPNKRKGKDGGFPKRMLTANNPQLAVRDGRPACPMSGEEDEALRWQLLGNVER